MSGLFHSIKSDLLDRRMLPLLALVVVALAAAAGYVALGSSSSSTPTASISAPAATGAGLTISATQAPASPAQSETTSGTPERRHGVARDPFAPIAGATSAATAKAASSTPSPASSATPSTSAASSTTGSGSSSSSSSSSPPASTPPTPEKSSPPPKSTTVYHVAVLLGVVPEPPSTPQLTPYENLKLLAPLPSAKQPLIVFRGVTTNGADAVFTLVGEAILHGPGSCLPSATQCQAVELKPKQSEQLEYLTSSGQTVTYELQVVSIDAGKASAASAAGALHGESKAGRELLRRAGLTALDGLHFSAKAGVLAFSARGASSARAHAARRPRRRRG